VAQFKFVLGNDGNESKFDPEEIKRVMNSGYASYHLVQKLLSSHPLSKNAKIGIYKITYMALNNKCTVGGIFCDLKAFDCASHDILLSKI
jgi:hypothetical protein